MKGGAVLFFKVFFLFFGLCEIISKTLMFGQVCVFFAEPKKQGFLKFISVFNRNWQKGGGCPFFWEAVLF